MSDERRLPMLGGGTPIFEPDYVNKIQERIEEGKRNAPEILRQIALFNAIKEKVENAKQK
jgi:hypothetical protein